MLLDDYLSPGQAARRLGMSRERVNQLRRAGRLESVPSPLGFLVRKADVERLERERAAGS